MRKSFTQLAIKEIQVIKRLKSFLLRIQEIKMLSIHESGVRLLQIQYKLAQSFCKVNWQQLNLKIFLNWEYNVHMCMDKCYHLPVSLSFRIAIFFPYNISSFQISYKNRKIKINKVFLIGIKPNQEFEDHTLCSLCFYFPAPPSGAQHVVSF